MKKILLVIMVILMAIPMVGTITVYANETNQEIVEEIPLETPSKNEGENNLDEYLSKLEEAKEIVKDIVKWIISAIIGGLGGLSVSLLFKKFLGGLVAKVLQGKNDISATKAETEKQVKEIRNEVSSTLASLEKSRNDMMEGFKGMKAQLIEENQKSNAELKEDINLIKKALPYIAGGMTELVKNGIAESVYDLLSKKGELNEESEEI